MYYKLLKDMPGVPAGTILKGVDFSYSYWDTENVDNKFAKDNTDFFEPIPEKTKTVWDLEEGDTCFLLFGDGESHKRDFCEWYENSREGGNIFLTEEEAEKELAYRKAKTAILKHHAEHSGFVPDWKDANQSKYSVSFSHSHGSMAVTRSLSISYAELVYFKTGFECEYSIRDCAESWKIIFGVK